MSDILPPLSEDRARARAAERPITADALLAFIVDRCRERRGGDIVSLDMRPLVDYMDHLLIVTGRSKRQNQAIARHVIAELKRSHRQLPISRSGLDGGTWICLDYLDVVLHVFDEETRAHYDLELRWADAAKTEHEAGASTADDDEAPDMSVDDGIIRG